MGFIHKSISKTVQPDIRFSSFADWLRFIASQSNKKRNTKTTL